MGKRIYVGNIPFSATEEELRELFAQHGSVTGVDVISGGRLVSSITSSYC